MQIRQAAAARRNPDASNCGSTWQTGEGGGDATASSHGCRSRTGWRCSSTAMASSSSVSETRRCLTWRNADVDECLARRAISPPANRSRLAGLALRSVAVACIISWIIEGGGGKGFLGHSGSRALLLSRDDCSREGLKLYLESLLRHLCLDRVARPTCDHQIFNVEPVSIRKPTPSHSVIDFEPERPCR